MRRAHRVEPVDDGDEVHGGPRDGEVEPGLLADGIIARPSLDLPGHLVQAVRLDPRSRERG
jgi:hypothetical protein